MQRELLLTFLLTTPIFATSMNELVQSALTHNSLMEKTELQSELMEAKQEESQAKRFGQFDVVGSYTHYNLPQCHSSILLQWTNKLFSVT